MPCRSRSSEVRAAPAAFALAAAALAAAPAPAGEDAAPDPKPLRVTEEVQAELLDRAPTPTLKQIQPYDEALGVYKYRVVGTRRGGLKPDTVIAVTHWVIYRNVFQDVTRMRPGGKRVHLRLCPFDRVRDRYQTVYRSELAEPEDLPTYHDLGQRVRLPPEQAGRWNYGAGIGYKMPLFFALKDQLKCVALGDCQGWFANRTEFYMTPENLHTPVALNLCEPRSGLPYQKIFIEEYLVKLPKLEWVVLTWNPRFVSDVWKEHGVRGEMISKSPGLKYDREHAEEVWAPGGKPPITRRRLEAMPQFAAMWAAYPYGWIEQHCRKSARGEVLTNQRKLGLYKLLPQRWAIFESIVETVAKRKAKLLAFSMPNHPETAKHPVKDKMGTDEAAYRDQVRRMRELEKKYPRSFFFYDINNMGDNGLADADFVNIDHLSGSGALKVARRVEAFRLQCEARLAQRKPSAGLDPAALDSPPPGE